MADTKFEVVLEMTFLKISNANVAFDEEILTLKSYTTNKALPTTEQIQLVDPKEFIIAALGMDSETFVVYMAIREWEKMPVHAERQAQIQDGAQVGALLFDEAPTKVPIKYSNYSDVFSTENAVELPENTGINEHAIELEEGKQPLFEPIYSLGPVELETLKTYIEINLGTSLSCPPRLPPEYLSSLIGSHMEASAFVWIIGVSTISQSRTDIRYPSSGNLSINSAGQSNSPN